MILLLVLSSLPAIPYYILLSSLAVSWFKFIKILKYGTLALKKNTMRWSKVKFGKVSNVLRNTSFLEQSNSAIFLEIRSSFTALRWGHAVVFFLSGFAYLLNIPSKSPEVYGEESISAIRKIMGRNGTRRCFRSIFKTASLFIY